MSKRQNHPNIRTKFKNLLKDLRRNKITYDQLTLILREEGIDEDVYPDISQILKTNIPARIISRLAKKAKKMGAYLPIKGLIQVWRAKQGDSPNPLHEIPSDYHLIPFVKIKKVTQQHIQIEEYLQRETIDGNLIRAKRFYHNKLLSRTCKIVDEKYI